MRHTVVTMVSMVLMSCQTVPPRYFGWSCRTGQDCVTGFVCDQKSQLCVPAGTESSLEPTEPTTSDSAPNVTETESQQDDGSMDEVVDDEVVADEVVDDEVVDDEVVEDEPAPDESIEETETDIGQNDDDDSPHHEDPEEQNIDDDDAECGRVGCVNEWVVIEGGEFRMGSESGGADERPTRGVMLAGFEILRTEVTVESYRRCVDDGSCDVPSEPSFARSNWDKRGRQQHPINAIYWDQAVAYCEWLSARLPNEAEWEFAARSRGLDMTYPWGEEAPDCDRAVMNHGGYGCGLDQTQPVCSRPEGSTQQGLCDMAGNVAEWIDNIYGPYDDGPQAGPDDGYVVEIDGTYRVVRGGSFTQEADAMRTTARNRYHPRSLTVGLGFRCVR